MDGAARQNLAWTIHPKAMTTFATLPLPTEPTAIAPDGSNVRALLGLQGGSMAHFELPAGRVAKAVTHRTVEEICFIVAGRGQMWRRQGTCEEVIELAAGVCLSIPVGTHFQFRAAPDQSVMAVAVTLPPWPGDDEAVLVSGPWPANV